MAADHSLFIRGEDTSDVSDAVNIELMKKSYLANIQYERNRQSEIVRMSFEEWFRDSWQCEYDSYMRWHFNQFQAWQTAYKQGMKDAEEKK